MTFAGTISDVRRPVTKSHIDGTEFGIATMVGTVKNQDNSLTKWKNGGWSRLSGAGNQDNSILERGGLTMKSRISLLVFGLACF